MAIHIEEIIERSVQGMTRPFVCRGEDGHVYFVKGRGAGRRSLICEWIAGKLAVALGLPIAPFEVVQAPASLLRYLPVDDQGDLDPSLSFGSRRKQISEIACSMIPAILESLRRDVVVFDYWICNMDRYLGEHGGNPNLFWEPQSEQLVVIDHNQAFDADFSLSEFASTHVFRGDLHQVFSDSAMQQGYQQRLRLALSRWGEICDTVPAEWWWFDDEETIPADFNRDQAYRCLSRIDEEGFWRLP